MISSHPPAKRDTGRGRGEEEEGRRVVVMPGGRGGTLRVTLVACTRGNPNAVPFSSLLFSPSVPVWFCHLHGSVPRWASSTPPVASCQWGGVQPYSRKGDPLLCWSSLPCLLCWQWPLPFPSLLCWPTITQTEEKPSHKGKVQRTPTVRPPTPTHHAMWTVTVEHKQH